MRTMTATVTIEPAGGGVTWLRFRSGRPGNALTLETLRLLRERWAEALEAAPHVLLIAGAADAFSVGADVEEMAGVDADGFRELVKTELDLFHEIEEAPVGTVAVLAGLCVGNGAELALACDLRVAAADCRFSYPEARLGLAGPATRLARFVGLGRAKDILLTGRALTAAETLQFGLVSAVAEDDLDAAALRIAQRLARTPLQGIRLTKSHIGDVYRLADTYEDELLAQSLELFQSEEVQAILRAATAQGREEGGPAGPR
jgi:enoyl-CoA hydratase/carnithine racemase